MSSRVVPPRSAESASRTPRVVALHCAALLLFVGFGGLAPLRAAIITVTTTADSVDANLGACAGLTLASLPGPDGEVSVREAVCAANAEAGPDVIQFSTPGVFTLTIAGVDEDLGATGDLDVRDELTIQGLGAGSTILQAGSAGPPTPDGIDRVLDVFFSSSNQTLFLSGVTVRHGRLLGDGFDDDAGGGIRVLDVGRLFVEQSVIVGNTGREGGGIRCRSCTLVLFESEVSGNVATTGPGGGISAANSARMSIAASAVTSNRAGSSVFGGGGIFLFAGEGDIVNTTISGNETPGSGGGVRTISTELDLTHVTITGNTAATTSGNGGGLAVDSTSTVRLKSTIVAGNSLGPAVGATGPDCDGVLSPTTPGYNFIGDSSGCTGFAPGAPNANLDWVDAPNLLLGAPTGNPPYHPLAPGSSALDWVPAADCTYLARPVGILFVEGQPADRDQPGTFRPQSSLCDIGAFELLAPTDLALSKSASVEAVPVGGAFEYTLTVDNVGAAAAENVIVTDPLPAGVALISTSGCAEDPVGIPTCTLGSIPDGGSAAFSVVVSVTAAVPSLLTNIASVTSSIDDTNPDNDTASETTAVISPSDVSGTKTVSGRFSVGATITYVIVLVNSSTTAQLDDPGSDELVDVLPASLALLGATADSGAVNADTGTNTVTWNGSIGALGSVTIEIEATILAGFEGIVENQATIFFDADGDGENDTSRGTDDPGIEGLQDPTIFVLALLVPTLGAAGMAVLALLITFSALLALRRVR